MLVEGLECKGKYKGFFACGVCWLWRLSLPLKSKSIHFCLEELSNKKVKKLFVE